MAELVVVASTNPVKQDATRQALAAALPDRLFDVIGLAVPSGVSDQPMTDKETLDGARNRAEQAKQFKPEAAYWVGIEGGVQIVDNQYGAFAWAVVISNDQSGQGRTSEFFLPKRFTELVESGKTLGEATDIIFHQNNSAQKGGAVGALTGGAISRAAFNRDAVIMALVPFINKSLYS